MCHFQNYLISIGITILLRLIFGVRGVTTAGLLFLHLHQVSKEASAQYVRINRSIYRDRLPNLSWLDGRSRDWLEKKKKKTETTSSLSEDDKDKREAEDQVSWMDGEVNRHKLTISHLDQLIRHELMRWQFLDVNSWFRPFPKSDRRRSFITFRVAATRGIQWKRQNGLRINSKVAGSG